MIFLPVLPHPSLLSYGIYLQGKMVCVCDIPTMLPLLKPHADAVNRINKAIAEALER